MTPLPIVSAHTNYLIGQIFKEQRGPQGPPTEEANYTPMDYTVNTAN